MQGSFLNFYQWLPVSEVVVSAGTTVVMLNMSTEEASNN
jgi:hypothetical protein